MSTHEDHAVAITEAIEELALAYATPTEHPSWAPHGAIVLDLPGQVAYVRAEARSRLVAAIAAALRDGEKWR